LVIQATSRALELVNRAPREVARFVPAVTAVAGSTRYDENGDSPTKAFTPTRVVIMGKTGFNSIYRLVPAAVLAAAMAAAPVVTAQTREDSALHRIPTRAPTTTNPTSTLPQTEGIADTAVIRQVRASNLLETMLGDLAGKKSSTPAVKQFGQQMVTDHSRMGSQWASLGSRSGLPTPSLLDPAQRQLVTRLSSLSGAEFDREYTIAMVQGHQTDISTLQSLGQSAQSPAVRQLAANDLPTIQQHLTMAQQLANQVGAAVATTSTGLPAPSQPGRVGGNDKAAGNRERADQYFVQEVWQGHDMEVQLAELAQKKAKDPKVKQLADNLRNDFSDYRKRWADLASKNSMTVPARIGHLHRDKVDRLEKASRGQFDRVYLDIVRENLASMVPYFQKEGRQAQSSQVRELVNKELPTIQQHLSRAETLDRQAQANGKSPRKEKSLSDNK
jgi:putative membrane protein